MPRFSYNAIDHQRKTVKGTLSAESPYAARKHLRTKGLHPTQIKELSFDRQQHSLLSVIRRTNKSEIAEFTKQMATMLNAGIKLTDTMAVLLKQINDTRFRNAISDIRDRVVTGESLAESMAEYDQYFDLIYVSMVRVGELTGTLPLSLSTISGFMEKQQKVASKMATAMVYPIILLIACLMAVLFLTLFVLPGIVEQIKQAGQELPWLTQALMSFSNTLTSWLIIPILAVMFGIVWGIKTFFRTEKGAYLRDKTILSLPIFGPLLKKRIISRFASTLSTLLGAGMSMAESLKIVAEVTGNTIMKHAVHQARDRILSGADIATPLRESGVIDPAIAHMVTVGEKSGELEIMLKNISDNLESSSDLVIERLSAAFEPIIIILMAVVVGVIALAILLPILQITSGRL